MKKQFYRIITMLCMFLCTTRGPAQVRPDIYSFTIAQRTQLVNAMLTYITPTVIQQHCDYTAQTGSSLTNIHSDFDFLPFHRVYIELMEDYLMSLGPSYQIFVPLPKWDPSTCVPLEFQVMNNACSITCGNTNAVCGLPSIWCPGVFLPSYLNLPVNPGGSNDLCDWVMNPTTPPVVTADWNCCPSGLSRIIEGQTPNTVSSTYHNSVHVSMGSSSTSVMANFRSPTLPAFFLWHAFVDDIWKEWEGNCPTSNTANVDLYMKDNHRVMHSGRDRGEQPNIDNGPIYLSEDIWVRNAPDGFANQVHQNPIADGVNPVFVYVRVRNRGLITSTGVETLDLRWAKASTALTWPTNWNGTFDLDGPGLPFINAGDLIGTQSVTAIDAGDQQIFQFTWFPPNPSDYNFNPDPQHFCLLARVISPSSHPFEVLTETSNLPGNVVNNNGIVWKNLTVIDNNPAIAGSGLPCNPNIMQAIGASVSIGNVGNPGDNFDITFDTPHEVEECDEVGCTHDHCMVEAHVHDFSDDAGFHQHVETVHMGLPITSEGTVFIAMDDLMYQRWKDGGKIGEGFEEIKSGEPHPELASLVAGERHMFQITSCPTTFGNVFIGTDEMFISSIMVLYPTIAASDKVKFKYDVIQRKTVDGLFIGAVQYEINKPDCSTSAMSAGPDQTINKGCETTLAATPVMPCVNYWWRDANGNVIAHNTNAIVSPNTTTTYTLIAVSANGCISEDQVTITVLSTKCLKKTSIISLSPNPADVKLTITYKLDGTPATKFMLLKVDNTFSSLYDTDPAAGGMELTISISDLPSGLYAVIMICDGMSVDHKMLIIE